jgi:MoxR-like ATPase
MKSGRNLELWDLVGFGKKMLAKTVQRAAMLAIMVMIMIATMTMEVIMKGSVIDYDNDYYRPLGIWITL